MKLIDKCWNERTNQNTDGNPVQELASSLFDMLKQAYIEGWIDCIKNEIVTLEDVEKVLAKYGNCLSENHRGNIILELENIVKQRQK